MTEYERKMVQSDTIRELLNGLKGPWFLKWDNSTGTLSCQCCNCGKRIDIIVKTGTLVKELTHKLAHKCP